MSKCVAVSLGIVMLAVALMGAALMGPLRALAASGTLTVATPLHDAPTPDATVVTLLPEGAIVSIEGEAVDGFYPVTAEGLSGWLPGETLLIPTDEVPDDTEAAMTGDQPVPAAPAETAPATDPIASDTAAVPEASAPVDPATGDPSVAQEPVAEPAPETDPAAASAEPPAPSMDPAATDGTDPALAPEAAALATPVAGDAIAEDPLLAPVGADQTPLVDPALIAFPDAGPSGPASVIAETPILLGPGGEFGVITTAPAGSPVQQTGHAVNGFVTVQFGGITGWAQLDHLGPPQPVTSEPVATDLVPATGAEPVAPDAAPATSAEPAPSARPPDKQQPPPKRGRNGHRRR